MTPIDDVVFVFDRDGWLYIQRRADAEGYFEAVDVEAGEYGPAWDAAGEGLSIGVDGHGRTTFQGQGRLEPDRLETALLHFASEHELELDGTGDTVLDVANAFARWEWNARWPKRPRWLAQRLRGTEPPRYIRP